MTDHDVVVAGAGLVGSSAALVLAGLGRRVAVVEPRVPERHPGRSGYEARTVALNPAARALLERYVDWRALDPHPFHAIKVWEDTGTRAISFAAAEVQRSELGWIVEVGRAAGVLWQAMEDADAITLVTGRSVDAIAAEADAVVIRAGDDALSTRLLIGADGAHSAVRALLGVEAPAQPTPHAALATVVRTERDSDGVAYQRFLDEGPLALLPLPGDAAGGWSSLVWSQPRDEARRRVELSERAFAAELEAACEAVLGAILAVDERFVFDLDQRLAESFHPQPRCILVGDAARVLHPLAGQGVNIGLEDVHELEVELTRRSDPMHDPGAPGLWRGWARRRRAKALLLLRAMDAFRVGYGATDPLLRLARNIGVAALDRSPLLKTQLIREAMGVGLSAL